MTSLDSKVLKRFLDLASQRLTGDWLLVGGTLLPAVGIQVRNTIDIDLVEISGSNVKNSNQHMIDLMDIAASLGLPVDTINQAAAYFVKKAGYKNNDLIVLKKGKRATIHRPSVELYWRLKIKRLTEADASDCQHYLAFCSGQGDRINIKVLRDVVDQELRSGVTPEKRSRLESLRRLLPA
jgi:hypothetical protein